MEEQYMENPNFNVGGLIDDVIAYKKGKGDKVKLSSRLYEFESALVYAGIYHDGEKDTREDLEQMLDQEPLNNLVRWMEERGADLFDFHRSSRDWIMACDSEDAEVIGVWRVNGTEDQVKDYLISMIHQYQTAEEKKTKVKIDLACESTEMNVQAIIGGRKIKYTARTETALSFEDISFVGK